MTAVDSTPARPGSPKAAGRPLAVPLYLGGGALSLLGNSVIGIVLPWLVIARTGDLSTTALVAAVAGLAAVPASLLGGRLADRFGARRVAVAADLGSAGAVAALAVVDLTVGLSVAWFVVLGAAGAVFDVPGMTARQSLLADVAAVGGRSVDAVAGLFQTSFSLAFLAGPALAGLLLSILDPIDMVWLTAACSAGAALLTWFVPVSHGSTSPDGAEAPAGAWSRFRADPRLRAILLISFTGAFVIPPLLAVVLPGHFAALDEPGAFGMTVSAFAVGSLIGSVGYAVIGRRSRPAAYACGIVLMSIGLALIAPLGGVWLTAGAMGVLGIGSGLFGPVWNVFVAEQVPVEVRGRVLSWFNAASLVAGPIGLGLLAALLTRAELSTAAIVIAAGWMIVAVFALASRHARAIAHPLAPGGEGGGNAGADEAP